LVELDGATGKERRRFPIPPEATDCLAFVNLSGSERATDVLVKTRYSQIWAYNYDGKLLWTVENPGGYRTAHQATPIDIDGDGKDEIVAGYALLNPDGTVRWQFESEKVDLGRGHLDCCRVLRKGEKPEDWRLVLTCCGANNIATIDGNGKTMWEVSGHHFESVQIGKVFPDLAGLQILVDIDHRPTGEGPLWLLDENGAHLGQIMTDYCRIHASIDWDGDGYDEMAVAYPRGLFDREGKRILTFEMDTHGTRVVVGDMTGDGKNDLTLDTGNKVFIFRNENNLKVQDDAPLGSGINFTFY
jgi:outer membrane protein assembly factor BamB